MPFHSGGVPPPSLQCCNIPPSSTITWGHCCYQKFKRKKKKSYKVSWSMTARDSPWWLGRSPSKIFKFRHYNNYCSRTQCLGTWSLIAFHILVIIIYRLRHCWHARYEECLCPGQLGCVSIIRISSGLPGGAKKKKKKSRQGRIVCPLYPSHSKHIDSLCKTERVYEWISASSLTR